MRGAGESRAAALTWGEWNGGRGKAIVGASRWGRVVSVSGEEKKGLVQVCAGHRAVLGMVGSSWIGGERAELAI